jgi:hypothetical protein
MAANTTSIAAVIGKAAPPVANVVGANIPILLL